MAVTFRYRPGFIIDMDSIHYAKWFLLPGTGKLIFLSNYDGSWESYLEDFITKAHAGQTAVWSNADGFPRTRALVLDGAQDGDRFKQWVRLQQVPTQFWYSRIPTLTTDQIRTYALIHHGLLYADNNSLAKAWLGCFGSMTRPEYAIESDEVQSLVFSGLQDLPYAALVVLRLPDNDPDSCTAWLKWLMPQISFGDLLLGGATSVANVATCAAFSATGLAKLGLPDQGEDGLGNFPAAFTMGMTNRVHILGDQGTESGKNLWRWEDRSRPPEPGRDPASDAAGEVVLMVYAKSELERDAALVAHVDHPPLGTVILSVVKTHRAPKGRDFEFFGFRDGISQPVLRGTQRYIKGALPRDIVEPGEFILGYRNNEGYFPPSLTLQRDLDPKNRLPLEPDELPGRYPRFDAQQGAKRRDFGRNGTFVAIRQLAQDVGEFHKFTKEKVTELQKIKGLDGVVHEKITVDWVAAKMVGRWRDGTPLIDRAGPTTRKRPPSRVRRDNDFDFASEDPQGLLCPFGAHIRRANPRDSLEPGDREQAAISNRHRILRRGRSYEQEVGGKREQGLLFIGICGDLERQFEVIQQTWLNAPNFSGLTDEPDPFVTAKGYAGERQFTIPTSAGPIALKDMKSFVTVKGGGYFFMPSRAALRCLVDLDRRRQPVLPPPEEPPADRDRTSGAPLTLSDHD